MIVNELENTWEIIYQRSHANLAAILVAAWQKKDHVPRWTELIIATAQHDDQEMFWSDTKHLSDEGIPLDFTESELDTRRIQAESVIENAYRQGLWIALLISCHNSFLYEPNRGEDKNLDEFLDQQKQNQETWRKTLGYSRKTVDSAYTFVRWADALSLILCRRELPEYGQYVDVAPDKYGNMIQLTQRPDNTLSLTPWILEDDELEVSVEARYLEKHNFSNEIAFQKALSEATIKDRVWCFKK